LIEANSDNAESRIKTKWRNRYMTMHEYQALGETVRWHTLRREGCYIGKRQENGFQILMFQLGTFYVEIFYRKHRCHIERWRCLNSTLFLEPYLNQIDISTTVS
jgi:hypothetical protein